MNCGANVLDEPLLFVVERARMFGGIDGEDPSGEKDWFLE